MRRVLAVLVLALALAGCSATHDVPSPKPDPVHTERPPVDLHKLEAIKKKAGIRDCLPGSATTSKLPELTLQCLGGGAEVDLHSLRGPMLIGLFASWCENCKDDLPTLQDFDQAYGKAVPVIGVDYEDTSPESALELAKDTHVTFPLLADPMGEVNANSPLPRIPGLPLLIFVDSSGNVAGVAPGPMTSLDTLVTLTNGFLGTKL